MPQYKASVPTRKCRLVIFIVDTRGTPMVARLEGNAEVPLPLTTDTGHYIRWKLPDWNSTPQGVITDLCEGGVVMVFPISEMEDARKNGVPLLFDDIVREFIAFEPALKLVSTEVR